jgi:hypothetical protein
MLIYESAACLHGRRSVLKGKYYASVSLYYAPTDKAVWNYTIDVSKPLRLAPIHHILLFVLFIASLMLRILI